MRKILLLFGALLFILPSKATLIDGLNYSLDDSNMTASVSENRGISGNLVIPASVEYNGKVYSVTSLGDWAFSGCNGLTSVKIPNSVTSIRSGAFYGCSGLSSVVIGNSVTSIGDWAFQLCSGLTSVVIGNSVTSIGAYAFKDCKKLIKSAYPNNLANPFDSGISIAYEKNAIIEDGVIFSANKRKIIFVSIEYSGNYEIPGSVTNIEERAFYGCSGLTGVEIPNSVTNIAGYAFYGCSGLTGVKIPNSVTEIGDYTFFGCTGLSNLIFNAENCTTCGSYYYPAFPNCINSLTIGQDVKNIPAYAFSKLNHLTSVEIPDSVTEIGEYAFYSCSGLTSIVIPNSVTEIGDDAFYGCKGLTNVALPNSVTSIGNYTFCGCSSLTNIEIPNSVTEIKFGAFKGCSGLTGVTLPSSVTSVGKYAFEGCSGLKSITFNSSDVLSLDEKAFSECHDIEIITCNTRWAPVAQSYDVFEYAVYFKAKLYVPERQKTLYSIAIPWNQFRNINGMENTPDEDENDYKIIPVLLPSQTLTLGVKNMRTGILETSFSWNSSDELVADVDSQGVVTAKAVGETVISATNTEGESAEFEIIVMEGDDNSVPQDILLESKTNNNVYTLGGLVVIRDATQEDLRSLASGLYIIGGKKVMVK